MGSIDWFNKRNCVQKLWITCMYICKILLCLYHSYLNNLNFFIRCWKKQNKKLCPWLQRKMVFCVKFCFPSKPVFYLQKYWKVFGTLRWIVFSPLSDPVFYLQGRWWEPGTGRVFGGGRMVQSSRGRRQPHSPEEWW